MGVDKRTVKIIVIVAVVLLVIGGIVGLVLGLLLSRPYVELEVWPRSEEYNWNQPVIQFRPGDAGSWQIWYKRINDFLRDYETTVPEDPPRAPCSTHNYRDQQMRSDTCAMAMRVWGPCTADNYYGYADGSPCVFLRLSHIHYWVPEPYNMTSPLPLPNEMPEQMKTLMVSFVRSAHTTCSTTVHAVHGSAKTMIRLTYTQLQRPAHQYGDYIWVSCEGEFNADKENIGPIMFIPFPGFPTNRLHTADRIPYSTRNMPDQVQGPVIAVHFEHPRRGLVISVECRIWTRDIFYDRSSRYGRARFELFVE